ncbi:MAG: 3-isopropylmalate dehydratase large subunit [Alphaproteobacteria bacterium]|nr:3-isopropylmalate dehydratase large subunit [Alphaproteobacteria bacterium]
MAGETLFDKIWQRHVVRELDDDAVLIHIDRHIIHECTSGAAFAGLAKAGRRTRRPDLTYAVIDHILSTRPGRSWDTFEGAKEFVSLLRRNTAEHGIGLIDVDDPRQGIEHVIAAELGISLPGTTLVCGDSHTATCGAMGCLAWGIGTSEVAHVLATQTIVQRRPKRMRVRFEGGLRAGVHAKDMILALIGRIGIAAGTGHAVEYAGSAVRALGMDARQTICNMSIEFGARSGMIAPDDTTLAHLDGRPFAPAGRLWDEAVAYWRTLRSDDDAVFDREVELDCSAIEPQVTWGTTPGDVVGIGERVPDPSGVADSRRRQAMERALGYMGLHPRDALEGLKIDVAFIGSCTNSRLADLEAAARVVRGRKVPSHVRALVAPGSAPVKRAAEAMGLDKVFTDAGFEWRESGCSMCVAINDDSVGPDQRCISTSNRNFENRQGPRSRTHLASPATVAASAVRGAIADVRKLGA